MFFQIWDGTNKLSLPGGNLPISLSAGVSQISGSSALPVAIDDFNNQFLNVTGITAQPVTAVPCTLKSLVVNTPLASGVVKLYNNTGASGPLIGTVTYPTLLSTGPEEIVYGLGLSALSVSVSGAALDVTVIYKNK